MTKDKIKEKEKQLLEMTGSFCIQKLDEEYFNLCEKLILKMGRKREVPFKRGKLEIWAGAVIHTIGSINFLSDKSFEPYMSTDEICQHFDVKKSTVTNKARQIKDMFDLYYFDPEFSTDQMNERSPSKSMVMVDGFIVPVESISEEMQELVRQERSMGRDISFTTVPE